LDLPIFDRVMIQEGGIEVMSKVTEAVLKMASLSR
jgi:hypothetical protein